MLKRILIAGIGGAVVLIAWSFIANGVFGLRSRVDLNRIPNESRVYDLLKENIVTPGAYVCNPPLTPGGAFPPGEPVFGIRYSGMGHEAAGSMLLLDLAVALAASMIAAWLLALASERVSGRYSRSAGFVVVIGLLIAIFSDLPKLGIGAYPLKSMLLLSAYDLVAWTLCGLVIAWLMRRGARGASTTPVM